MALNNPQGLICNKTRPINQSIISVCIYWLINVHIELLIWIWGKSDLNCLSCLSRGIINIGLSRSSFFSHPLCFQMKNWREPPWIMCVQRRSGRPHNLRHCSSCQSRDSGSARWSVILCRCPLLRSLIQPTIATYLSPPPPLSHTIVATIITTQTKIKENKITTVVDTITENNDVEH